MEGGGDKETIITSTRIEEACTSVVTHAWHWKLVLHVASSQQREQYTAKKGLMNSLLFINIFVGTRQINISSKQNKMQNLWKAISTYWILIIVYQRHVSKIFKSLTLPQKVSFSNRWLGQKVWFFKNRWQALKVSKLFVRKIIRNNHWL